MRGDKKRSAAGEGPAREALGGGVGASPADPIGERRWLTQLCDAMLERERWLLLRPPPPPPPPPPSEMSTAGSTSHEARHEPRSDWVREAACEGAHELLQEESGEAVAPP